jgi:hypothetical protein
MGLSEFPDTLSPVILHFGGAIGDKRPWGRLLLRLLIIAYICILVEAWSW